MSKKSRIGYMCLIDYEYHLENDINSQEVYPTIDEIKFKLGCVNVRDGCPIAKVKIQLMEIIK